MLAFFGGALSSVPAANIRAVLLNVNAPETRGTIFSFYALMVCAITPSPLPTLLIVVLVSSSCASIDRCMRLRRSRSTQRPHTTMTSCRLG